MVKVAYYLFLLTAILIAVLGAWESRPIPTVDREKSTITCVTNGKSYSLATVQMYGSLDEIPLGNYDFDKGNEFCLKNKTYYLENENPNSDWQIVAKYDELPNYGIEKPTVESMAAKGDYSYKFSINIVEKIQGSWDDSLLWLVLVIGGAFIILNIIREALNYLFLGKEFDFQWYKSTLGISYPKHPSPDQKAVKANVAFFPKYESNKAENKSPEQLKKEVQESVEKSLDTEKKDQKSEVVFLPNYEPNKKNQNTPMKRLVALISTRGKSTEQVSKEAWAAVQKYRKAMEKSQKKIQESQEQNSK